MSGANLFVLVSGDCNKLRFRERVSHDSLSFIGCANLDDM